MYVLVYCETLQPVGRYGCIAERTDLPCSCSSYIIYVGMLKKAFPPLFIEKHNKTVQNPYKLTNTSSVNTTPYSCVGELEKQGRGININLS